MAAVAMWGEAPQDCRLCSDLEQAREWGCLAPTRIGYAEIDCPRCKIPDPNEKPCHLCRRQAYSEETGKLLEGKYFDGDGRLLLTLCPYAFADPKAWRVAESVELFMATHLPPVAGGLADQANVWVEALRILVPIREDIQARAMKQAQGG